MGTSTEPTVCVFRTDKTVFCKHDIPHEEIKCHLSFIMLPLNQYNVPNL